MHLYHMLVLLWHLLFWNQCDSQPSPTFDIKPTALLDSLHVLMDVTGVQEVQKYVDNEVTFEKEVLDSTKLLEVAKQYEDTVKSMTAAIKKVKAYVEGNFNAFKTEAEAPSCCDLDSLNLEYNAKFQKNVDISTYCYYAPWDYKDNGKFPPAALTDEFKKILADMPSPGFQYFATEEGLLFTYPAIHYDFCLTGNKFDPRIRPWYTETVAPVPKNVVFVLDSSLDMFRKFLGSRKLHSVASEMVLMLVDAAASWDKISVVSFSQTSADVAYDTTLVDKCFSVSLALATVGNRQVFKNYVNKTDTTTSPSNYSAGLEKAFDLLQNSQVENEKRMNVIIFITGVTPIGRTYKIFDLIKKKSKDHLDEDVSIITYAVGEVSSETKSVLKQMTTTAQKRPGSYHEIKADIPVREQLAPIFNFFIDTTDVSSNREPTLSLPYWDALGLGVIISLLSPLISDETFRGVAGLDIALDAVLKGVGSINLGETNYIFIVNRILQNVLFHPHIPVPEALENNPIVVKIEHVEKDESVKPLLEDLKLPEGGVADPLITTKSYTDIRTTIYLPNGDALVDGIKAYDFRATYHCVAIPGTKHAMCLAVNNEPLTKKAKLKKPFSKDEIKFTYHDLDIAISDPSNAGLENDFCSMFFATSVLKRTAIKLSPDCFLDPGYYVNSEEAYDKYAAYKDIIVENPDKNNILIPGVIEDVYVSSILEKIWTEKVPHKSASSALYRYFGTVKGVFRLSPGRQLPRQFDPRRRYWFKQAKANPGKIICTSPYLDDDGAGYLVTIGHAIVERSSKKDNPVVYGVMGVDIPYHYLHYLMANVSACQDGGYTCFLVTASGTIVYHPDWIHVTAVEMPTLSHVHIVELEPSIAEHMTKKQSYMKSTKCNSLFDGKERRHSHIELPIAADGRKAVYHMHDEGAWYQAMEVPQTNLIIVLYTRENVRPDGNPPPPQYCECAKPPGTNELKPCKLGSTNYQSNCECPCLADSTDLDTCLGTYNAKNWTVCAPDLRNPWRELEDREKLSHPLPSCLNHQCKAKKDLLSCFKYATCRWCDTDLDGEFAKNPFCGKLPDCWFGQIGNTWLYYVPPIIVSYMPVIVGLSVTGFILLCCCSYVIWRWRVALRVVEYYYAVGVLKDKNVDVIVGERRYRRESLKEKREHDPRQKLIEDYRADRYSIVTLGLKHPAMAAFQTDGDEDNEKKEKDEKTDFIVPPVHHTPSEEWREHVLRQNHEPNVFTEFQVGRRSFYVTDMNMDEAKGQLRRFSLANKGKEEQVSESQMRAEQAQHIRQTGILFC